MQVQKKFCNLWFTFAKKSSLKGSFFMADYAVEIGFVIFSEWFRATLTATSYTRIIVSLISAILRAPHMYMVSSSSALILSR